MFTPSVDYPSFGDDRVIDMLEAYCDRVAAERGRLPGDYTLALEARLFAQEWLRRPLVRAGLRPRDRAHALSLRALSAAIYAGDFGAHQDQ